MSDDDTERALGLRRVVVETSAGPVVARVGAPTGGAALLLIHGAAGSWRAWLPVLRAAADRRSSLPQVVAVDLPGWGESGDPLVPLDTALAARAVIDVAHAVGAERWTVVGHSLGGVVALAIAGLDADATARVVLVSPTGPAVLRAIRHPVRGGLQLPWFAGMLLTMRLLARLPDEGRGLLRALGRAGALGRLAAPLFADRGAVDPGVLRDLGAETRPAAFVRAARSIRAGGSTVAVTCPVRSVRGVTDVFVGRDDAAWFAGALPDFAETVVPGAGHFALVERPETVLAAVRDPASPTHAGASVPGATLRASNNVLRGR